MVSVLVSTIIYIKLTGICYHLPNNTVSSLLDPMKTVLNKYLYYNTVPFKFQTN